MCCVLSYDIWFLLVVCWFLFLFSSRRRHTRCALVTGVQTCALPISGLYRRDDRRPVVAAEQGHGVQQRLIEILLDLRRFQGGQGRRKRTAHRGEEQIGRASCRERVCQYV